MFEEPGPNTQKSPHTVSRPLHHTKKWMIAHRGQTAALWIEVTCAGDSIKSRKEGHKERRDLNAGRKLRRKGMRAKLICSAGQNQVFGMGDVHLQTEKAR